VKRTICVIFSAAALSPSLASCATALPATDRAAIAETVRHDVAEIVAGINAHDVDRATRFDASDIVSMEAGRPPSSGIASEREGLAMAFKYAPSWRLALVDETVDVANSGEMAVYRSTYDENSSDNGVAKTHRVNFIAGFERRDNGAWQVKWSVVSAQGSSHPL
jgi:ketosteroid isomerase-like protein